MITAADTGFAIDADMVRSNGVRIILIAVNGEVCLLEAGDENIADIGRNRYFADACADERRAAFGIGAIKRPSEPVACFYIAGLTKPQSLQAGLSYPLPLSGSCRSRTRLHDIFQRQRQERCRKCQSTSSTSVVVISFFIWLHLNRFLLAEPTLYIEFFRTILCQYFH